MTNHTSVVGSMPALPPGGGMPCAAQVVEQSQTVALWHGTTAERSRLIQQVGFQASVDGMFGPGLYLTSDRQKAEAWARFVANQAPVTDRVVPALVQVRAAVGRCREMDFDADPFVPAYQKYHLRKFSILSGAGTDEGSLEWDFALPEVDEFGRHKPNPLDDDMFASTLNTAKAFAEDGYDSLHIINNRKLKHATGSSMVTGSPIFRLETIDKRMVGDEWVLARASDATLIESISLDPGA